MFHTGYNGKVLNKYLKVTPQDTQHPSSPVYSVNTLSSFSVAGSASQLFCDHHARISVEVSVGTAVPHRQLPQAACSLRTMEKCALFCYITVCSTNQDSCAQTDAPKNVNTMLIKPHGTAKKKKKNIQDWT